MNIKSLPNDVRLRLRGGTRITSLCRCVQELIYNSLDANATSIAVRINLNDHRVQVVDNGDGIRGSDLIFLGLPYMTSKCQSLQDLNARLMHHYGFKGETLSSLTEISERLHLTSRAHNADDTFVVDLKTRKIKRTKSRPSKGTTVTVENLFYNLPTRKKRTTVIFELQALKKELVHLSIVSYNVSISLRDDVTREIVYATEQQQSMADRLLSLHNQLTNEDLIEVKYSKRHQLKILGLVSKRVTTPSVSGQYFFVNKRPVTSSTLQEFVRDILGKSTISLQANDKHIYVIYIKCPCSDVSIIYNTKQTSVDFNDRHFVEQSLKKCITNRLKSLRLWPATENYNEELKNSKIVLPTASGKTLGISQISNVCKSNLIKRKPRTRNERDFKRNKDSLNADKAKLEIEEIVEIEATNNDSESVQITKPNCSPIKVAKKKRNVIGLKRKSMANSERHNELIDKQIVKGFFDEYSQNQISETNKSLQNDTSIISLVSVDDGVEENNYQRKRPKTADDQYLNLHKNKIQNVHDKSVQTIVPRFQTCATQTSFRCECTNRAELKNDKMEQIESTVTTRQNLFNKSETAQVDRIRRQIFMQLEEEKSSAKEQKRREIVDNEELNGEISEEERNIINNSMTTNFSQIPRIEFSPLYKVRELAAKHFDKKLICSPYFGEKRSKINVVKLPNISERLNLISLRTPYDTQNFEKFLDETSNSFNDYEQNILSLDNDANDDGHNQNLREFDLNIANFTVVLPPQEETLPPFTNFTHMFDKKQHTENFKVNFANTRKALEQKSKPKSAVIWKNKSTSVEEVVLAEATLLDSAKIVDLTAADDVIIEETVLSETSCQKNTSAARPPLNTAKLSESFKIKHIFNKNCCVNKTTGMTLQTGLVSSSNFALKKRLDFIPKGLSPILNVETKTIDATLSPTSKRLLFEALIEDTHELDTVKWIKFIDNHDAKHFFDELYATKCQKFESIIPTILNKDNVGMDRSMFTNLSVIGQWDRKFIVTVDSLDGRLFLLDQHAVDERVRLELLLKDAKIDDSSKTLAFKITKCNPQIQLTLPTLEDAQLIETYKKSFNQKGLKFKTTSNTIAISHVPTCIHTKYMKDNNVALLKHLLAALVQEELEQLRTTGGVSSRIPGVIRNVLNLEACRGAIKFGDELTMNDCVSLLANLSKCQLPFQCAHGRPTIVPLMKLTTNNNGGHKNRPNLKRLLS